MMRSLELRPSDLEALLSCKHECYPIQLLVDGSPCWGRSQSEALSVDTLDLCTSLFEEEDMNTVLLQSPASIHLSPVPASWQAPPPAAAAASDDDDCGPLATMFDSIDDELPMEPCAKRQRTGEAAGFSLPTFCPATASASYGGIMFPAAACKPTWQAVDVQQLPQPLNAQVTFAGVMSQLHHLQPAQMHKASNMLFQADHMFFQPPALHIKPAPCPPGTLVPESELIPGRFSQPASPSPVKPQRGISASPNKPATPVRLAMRSPFVARPARLGFEGSASPASQETVEGPAPHREAKATDFFSEQDAIRLAAAALQACGGSADLAISYLRSLSAAC